MSEQVCMSLKGLLADPNFQKLQKQFPGRKPVELKTYLSMFIRQYHLADGWYPNEKFKDAFGEFMRYHDRLGRIAMARRMSSGTQERSKLVDSYIEVMRVFNNAQLRDAVDLVATCFRDELTYAQEQFGGTRAEALRQMGDGTETSGFEKIMNDVMDDFANETFYEIRDELIEREGGKEKVPNARQLELEQIAKRIKAERENIVKYKDHIIARAASVIGEQEGMRFEYKGILTDWQHESSMFTAQDDNEQHKREDGESKGSRYIDFSEKKLEETISPETKRFLSTIDMVDVDGKPYVTIFGTTRKMDYQQVAISLLRVLDGCYDSSQFMSRIKAATAKYPWMANLYDALEARPEMKPVVFVNCTRSTTKMTTVYTDKEGYQVGVANTSAKEYSIIRHMQNNMSGYTLGSKHSIYDGDGQIVKNLDYDGIKKRFEVLLNYCRSVSMREGAKPKDKYSDIPYMKLAGREAMDALLSEHPEIISEVVDFARGVGLDIDEKHVLHMAYDIMPSSKRYPQHNSRLHVFVGALKDIYNTASSGKYATADDLFPVIRTECLGINFALVSALYDEVEARVLVNHKTLSSHGNPNLIHMVSDAITNKEGLSSEEYKKMLMREWLQYEGFSKEKNDIDDKNKEIADTKYVGWLGRLYRTGGTIDKSWGVETNVLFNGVEYSKLSDQQKALASFIKWRKDGRDTYEFPIQGDYGTAFDFIKVPFSYIKTGDDTDANGRAIYHSSVEPLVYRDGEVVRINTDAPIVKAFADEVLLEIARIKAIRERLSDEDRIKLPVNEENGLKFDVFPEFNDNGFLDTYEKLISEGNTSAAYKFLMESVALQLDNIATYERMKFEELGVEDNKYMADDFVWEYDANKRPIRRVMSPSLRGEYQDYCLNQYYARIQMTRIFTGGFVHFPSTIEFEKRMTFMHTPHTGIYTENMADKEQHVLYVGDDVSKSAYIDYLTSLADAAYREGKITEYQRNDYVRAYQKIKSTDGMGLRTPESYIKLLEGLGQDVTELKAAHKRIVSGEYTPADIDMFLYAGQKLVTAGFQHIPAAKGELQKPVKLPVYHKYSEMVILPPQLTKSSMRARSEVMRGFSGASKALAKKGIKLDLILFASNVKLGVHDVIDPLGFEKDDSGNPVLDEKGNKIRKYKTAKQIEKYIVDTVTSDPDRYVQKIPWKYTGKAATMPTDVQNKQIVMPSQAKKAVFSNASGEIDVNGGMSVEEAHELYDGADAADIIDAYESLREIFDSDSGKKELEKLFQTEIAQKGYSKSDVMYALSLLENGEFAIPLCSNTVAKQVQEMLLSIISKRMTRIKTKGAHMHQITAIGIDQSSSPFASKQENRGLDDDELLGLHFKKETGKFQGIETYSPLPDKRLKIFADRDGKISPKRLQKLVEEGVIPEKFLEYYGLRTPSDNRHSIIPLYAKGFDANVAGASLAMSKEAMVATGGDFDGDEFHVFYKDFEIVWNEDKIRQLYKRSRIYSVPGTEDYMDEEDFVKAFKKKDKNILKTLGQDWRDYKKMVLAEYDFNKTALENSAEARNNLRNDIIFGMQTSDDGAQQLFMPNSNSEQDVQAKVTSVMKFIGSERETLEAERKAGREPGEPQSINKLIEAANKWNNNPDNGDKIYIDVSNDVSLYKSMMKLTVDQMNHLYNALNGKQSPYSISYAVEAFRRVMGGANMIDVFALFSSAHQMLQWADLRYVSRESKSGEIHRVTIMGHTLGKLFPILTGKEGDQDREYATLCMGMFLQDAVDNNKNPLLGLLNEAEELADFVSLLTASGMKSEKLNLFMTQPVMWELAKRLKSPDSRGFNDEAERLIRELVGVPAQTAGITEDIQKVISRNKALKDMDGYTQDDFISTTSMSYNHIRRNGSEGLRRMQADILYTLIEIQPAANLLKKVISCTRPESHSGTVGPTVAKTAVHYTNLQDLREAIFSPDANPRIYGVDRLIADIETTEASPEELFEATKGPNHQSKALNSLMYGTVMKWISKYMPQARESWLNLGAKIAKMYSDRTLNDGRFTSAFNDMITYKLLKNTSFIQDIDARRQDLTKDLPDRLKELQKRIKRARNAIASGGQPTDDTASRLVDNSFLDMLGIQKIDGLKRIKFNAGGPVTGKLSDKISNDWGDLILDEDESIRQLAIDLYMYNFMTNGYRFGMYEFSHFAPCTVLWKIPGFTDALREVLDSDFDYGSEDYEWFIDYYYQNHYDENRLVPLIDKKELPNGIREQFGMSPVYDDRKTKTYPLADIIQKHRFILVREKVVHPDGSKPTYVKRLYRVLVSPENNAVVLEPRQMLGVHGKHGQVTVYYNPFVNPKYIGKHLADINAESAPQDNSVDDDGNSLGIKRTRITDLTRSSETPSGDETNVERFVTRTPVSQMTDNAASRTTGPDEGLSLGIKRTRILRSEHENLAAKANQENEEILSRAEENDVTEVFEDGTPIYGPSDDPYLAERDQYNSYDDTSEAPTPEEYYQSTAEADEADKSSALANAFGGDLIPADELDQEAMNEGNERKPMPMVGIAEQHDGKVSIVKYPITPRSIRQARRQRAYIELNKRLRKMMTDNGVAAGVIDDIEARMGLWGVTDFDSAKVTAEGLKELIRLDKGIRGEYALPEEFSHLAIEMLGHDNEHVSRLLKAIDENESVLRSVFGDQYDEYEKYYEGDRNMMVLEAAGKLLAKSLLYEEENQLSWLQRLISNVVEAFRKLIRKFNIVKIDDAVNEAEGISSRLAKELLSGRLASQLDLDNIVMSGQLYNKQKEDITQKKDSVHRLLKIELKRLKVLKKRLAYATANNQKASIDETEKQISQLESAIKSKKTESAVYTYLSNALEFLRKSEESLNEMIDAGRPANSVCKKISVIHDVIYSYRLAINTIKDAINSGELAPSSNLQAAIDNTSSRLSSLLEKTDKWSMHYFQGTLREFYGDDGVEVTIGKQKGRHISIEEMATHGDKDISIVSRWVHSMGDCNDLVLKAIDGIVKKAKWNARNQTEAICAEINTAFSDLERKTGSKDQTFMFEYDAKGHRTGHYITKKAAESLNEAQREFYYRMMNIKQRVDKLLPSSEVQADKIVMLRKTASDKSREAKSFKDKLKYWWEAQRNRVLDTSENIDFDHDEVEMDFEGNRVDKLHVLFTKKGKGESYDDMSEDVASSMLAYAAMANEYYYLNQVIGELENARYMSARRQISQHAGMRLQQETVQNDDMVYTEDYTQPQSKSNIQQVLEDFMQMHVYGHLRRNEGTFGKTHVSKQKTVQTINYITSLTQLAVNLPQRIANITVGDANVIIHAAGGNAFDMKDLTWARGVYLKHAPERLLDTGANETNDKLSLFRTKFDVGQDNGRKYKEAKYARGRFAQVFNSHLLFAGLMIGEDMLASTTALAMARRYKVLDNTGAEPKESNLWEAYEVKYRDPVNKTGAYLSVKPGFTNMDGSPITSVDEQKFTNAVAATNFELQGIYNQDDKSAIQSTSIGALVMMYRKWIAPALKRRYGSTHYDHLKEQYEEGYYRTTGRLLADSFRNIIAEGQGIQTSFTVNWDHLTAYEKSNIHKAIREFAIIVGVVLGIGLLESLPPDDDKKGGSGVLNWAQQMAIYQLYRIRNELGSQAPTPLLARETLNMLESPFAAIEPIKDALNVFQLLLPSNYFEEVSRGYYKGHSKAYKYFWSLPVLSMSKQAHRLLDPSSMIAFYKNNNK